MRYFREAFAASAIYALEEHFEIPQTLSYISASKAIAASSLSFMEANYCRSLVEKNIEGQQTGTESFPLNG